MSKIRLSKKHGVNPSIMVCPCCSKDVGVALLGQLPKDAEAPMHIADSEPCKECKTLAETHLVIVSSNDGKHMTGSYVAIEESAARVIFRGLDAHLGFAITNEFASVSKKLKEITQPRKEQK